MSDYEGHCLPNDADLFAAMDDVAEFAVAHAAELTALERAAAQAKRAETIAD